MKILDYRINWFKGYRNFPQLQLVIEKEHKLEDFVFEQRGSLFLGKCEDQYKYFYYPGPGSGIGGDLININLCGKNKELIGPWSSRASYFNCVWPTSEIFVDVDFLVGKYQYAVPGCVKIESILNLFDELNVYPVKVYWPLSFPHGDMHQSIPGSNRIEKYFSYTIPTECEYIVVPSLNIESLMKP